MPDILIRRNDRVRIGPDARDKEGTGFMFIDATVAEQHASEYELTRHPVGQGLSIVDHKRAKPRRLTLECVISNTPLRSASTEVTSFETTNSVEQLQQTLGGDSPLTPATARRRDVEAWGQLKKMQADAELVTVFTTLETYDDMQIISITAPRNAAQGDSLHFTMVLEQVRIVNSKQAAAIQVQARPDEIKRSSKGSQPKTTEDPKANEVVVQQESKSILQRARG